MGLYKLPDDLLRIIYEYDDTYKTFYKSCINELKFLHKIFPMKAYIFFFPHNGIIIKSFIPISKLSKFHNHIFSICKRRQSLRSYKNYKYFGAL